MCVYVHVHAHTHMQACAHLHISMHIEARESLSQIIFVNAFLYLFSRIKS